MRLIALLARALVIALLALGCGYLVRVVSTARVGLAPPAVHASPPPAVAVSTPAPAPPAASAAPAPSATRAAAVAATGVANVAAAQPTLVSAPSSTLAPTPSGVAPAVVRMQAVSVPTSAVTSLRAPAIAATAAPSAPPPVVVAEAPPPVMAAPHDPPEIVDVQISSREIRAGDTVFGQVRTSSNVASVEARVAGYSSVLHKVGVGEFAIAYKVPPSIPFYLQHDYSLHLIARNIDGMQATRDLSVTLR